LPARRFRQFCGLGVRAMSLMPVFALPRSAAAGKILRLVARMPHRTLKTAAGIHREALKLRIKGVRHIPPQPREYLEAGPQDSRRSSRKSTVGGPAE
jgi:DUF1365 family protein